MSLSITKQFMCFMHFKRRREKQVDKILIWLANVTSKLEDNL